MMGRTRAEPSPKVSVVELAFGIPLLLVPLLAHGILLNVDGDLARHLVTGRHILERGPRFTDPFSFSRAGEPFLAYEWLSQVTLAVADGIAGLPGVVALGGLLLASSFALVVKFVRRGGDPWLAFIAGAAAAVLSSEHWIARPHLFTFLALPVLLHVLESDRRNLWLIPLFALWANLHPGFLYGLVMLAAWSTGSILEELRSSARFHPALARYALPPAIALAASFLTPFGWTLHAHTLELLGSETVLATAEFQPLVLTSVYGLLVLATVGLAVAILAVSREWIGWAQILVFGVAVISALAVRRNAPLLGLFALPMVARALAPAVRRLPERTFGRMRAEFERSDRRAGWRVPLGAAALLVAVLVADGAVGRVTLVPTEFSPGVFPAGAVRHARTAGLEGRLLSEYRWGGYVLYAWPGQRVFIDSMADFYGDAIVRDYLAMRNARRGWARKLDEHGISLVLFPPGAPLLDRLRVGQPWRVAYEDEVSVLMVRTPAEGRSPAPGTPDASS